VQHRQFFVDVGESHSFLGFMCQQRRWSPIDQFDRGLNYVEMPLALKIQPFTFLGLDGFGH